MIELVKELNVGKGEMYLPFRFLITYCELPKLILLLSFCQAHWKLSVY